MSTNGQGEIFLLLQELPANMIGTPLPTQNGPRQISAAKLQLHLHIREVLRGPRQKSIYNDSLKELPANMLWHSTSFLIPAVRAPIDFAPDWLDHIIEPLDATSTSIRG